MIDLYGAVEGIVITSSSSIETSSIVLSPAYELEQAAQVTTQISDFNSRNEWAHWKNCDVLQPGVKFGHLICPYICIIF